MRLRLAKEEGNDSLRTYLKKRFQLTVLADKIGTSNQNLHSILSGLQKRPDHHKLEAIAKYADLVLGYDESGDPYFEIPSQDVVQENEYISKEKLNAILQAKYAALSPEKRKLFDTILDFILDPDIDPDKKTIIAEMIRILSRA